MCTVHIFSLSMTCKGQWLNVSPSNGDKPILLVWYNVDRLNLLVGYNVDRLNLLVWYNGDKLNLLVWYMLVDRLNLSK